MCLAIPGKIIEKKENIALVDFGGIKKEVMLDLLPEAEIDDYILVHAGFAISKVYKEDIEKTLNLFSKI